MRYLLILIFSIISFSTMTSQTKSNKTTTYYLIRHAEKDRSNSGNKDPELTEIGLKRAQKWASIFKNIKFDKIYSSKFIRTIKTAEPTAIANSLAIEYYYPLNLYSEDFKENTKGKTVLIVGHSNTTPFSANKILGENKYPEMDDANFGNLYIVTVSENSTSSTLLSID